MREYAVPPLVEVDPTSNLTDFVVANATRAPQGVAFRRRAGERWQDVTNVEFLAEVAALAKGLVAAGVRPGDRVALMSKTRYEWTLTDFAIWFAGAVTVPLYETSSPDQVAWILADSGAVAVVVETAEHAGTVTDVRDQLPDLTDVWQIDAGGLADLETAGASTSAEELEARRSGACLDDLATIIYTSGTTGRCKGCELTHGNFVTISSNAVARLADVVQDPEASTLLFLPLAHVFARFIQVLCVAAGTPMGHTPDARNLLADLASYQPTFILAVPRVFERVFNASQQKAEAGGKGRIFDQAATTAIAWSRAQDTGGPALGLRLRHAVFDRLVYGKLRTALGGRAKYAVSGGAPLGERLGHFFRGIGLVVLEGYGLTETTAPSTVNTPERIKIGTVGPPLPGARVRIAEDGEVHIAGTHVFRGYWNNPDATAESFDGDWFVTGDLGDLDDDGFLRITGRKKEIIVTAGGKNVGPAVLEDRLRAHPLVSQCVVVGDQRPYIAALVTLDAEMLPTWLSNNDMAEMDVATASKDPRVHAEIERAVADANSAVSRAEGIRRFEVLDVDFTEESGHLTPSLKLKRSSVVKDHAAEVERLYAT